VRREDDEAALGHILDAGDEDGAALTKLVDDVRVVHDLLSDVDGRPVLRKRALDGLHGSLDACAVSARRREQDPLDHGANVAASHPGVSPLNAETEEQKTARQPPEASVGTPDEKAPRRTWAGRPQIPATIASTYRANRNKKREARRSGGRGGGPSQLLTAGIKPPNGAHRPVAETLARVDALANRPTGLSFETGTPARQGRFRVSRRVTLRLLSSPGPGEC
jgi:hypothetical protein